MVNPPKGMASNMLKDDVAAPATAQGRLLGIRGHDEAKDHIVRLWTSIRGSGQLSRVRLSMGSMKRAPGLDCNWAMYFRTDTALSLR